MPAFALHCRSGFKLAAFLLLVPLAAQGHAAPAFDEEVGFLGVRRERVAGERWDEGERNILTGLALYKLVNVYCSLHTCRVTDWSWQHAKRNGVRRRFDDVFAHPR